MITRGTEHVSPTQFTEWLNGPSRQLVYARGSLITSREQGRGRPPRTIQHLNELADLALEAAGYIKTPFLKDKHTKHTWNQFYRGKVCLTQRRIKYGWFEYIATKRTGVVR